MLNDKGTVNLTTKRLCLRRFSKNDAKHMYENWASNPKVTRYVTWFPHKSVEETQNIINNWVNEYSLSHVYQWAIELKEISEPIGSIGVVRMNEDKQSCEMGYCIGEKFWNKGYTSEALSAILQFLFEEVGFNRIAACHDVRNPNSGKVMEKCGLQYEGTMREVGFTKEGDKLTLSYYSILKREWLIAKNCNQENGDDNRPNFFDFRHKIFEMTFENFTVDETNAQAFKKIKLISDHSFIEDDAVFLLGPRKSGKTHLIEATLQTLIKKDSNLRIKYVRAEDFVGHVIFEHHSNRCFGEGKYGVDKYIDKCVDCDILVIEDIQFLKDKEFSQEAFAKLLEKVQNKKCKIIISSDTDGLENLNANITNAVNTFTRIIVGEQNENLLHRCLHKDIESSGVLLEAFNVDAIIEGCQNIQEVKIRLIEEIKTNQILNKEFSFVKPPYKPDFVLKMYASKSDGYRHKIDWDMLSKDESKRKRVAYKLYSCSGLSRKAISGILNCSQSEVDEGIHWWENVLKERPVIATLEENLEEAFEKNI